MRRLALVSDEEARTEYVRLVNQYSKVLLRFSLRRLNDRSSCDDVVAETFLIAWRRWEDLPAPDKELAWLYSIAFRVLSNYRRSRDRRDRLHTRLSLEREPSEGDDVAVDTEAILRAIAELRASEREILEFVYWERMTYLDIAVIMGISENAVGIRLNRAKKNLRLLLGIPRENVSNLRMLRGEVES